MSEWQAVEAVVRKYFQGLHEGDIAKLQAVFVRHAVINGYYEGECISQDLHAYLNVVKRLPSPILLGEDFDMEIAGFETVGHIASVRTRYLYEALRFTDYLSLMKIDGEWKIVSKLFHHD